MAKTYTKRKPKRRSAITSKNYVIIRSSSYKKEFRGRRIYFEGRKPKALKSDGQITLGKHVMEALQAKFQDRKFRWIITPNITSVGLERGIIRVRMAFAALTSMQRQSYDRGRDIKNDIVATALPSLYPGEFPARARTPYVTGTLARVLQGNVIPRLSEDDRTAMTAFLPGYVASASPASVSLLRDRAQIQSLKELARSFASALDEGYSESWWQKLIQGNILLIQQGYIAAIEKLNIALGDTKYPDFLLATHDGYLDVLEIKKPDTPLLKHDVSRNNYYWDSETSRAIIQVENYLEFIQKEDERLSRHILDKHSLQLRAIRPRGLILAGNTRKFSNPKQKDDFRRLSSATRNIAFLTYDELLDRLQNYIKILEDRSKIKKVKKSKKQSRETQ